MLVLSSAYLQAQQYSKSLKQEYKIYCSKQKKNTTNVFFWEDFDTGIFPPAGWDLISGPTPHTWESASFDVGYPISGEYFAICRYDYTYQPQGQDEKLFTPVFNLSGLNDATLSFWFIFSKYWGIYPHNNYDLQVLLSKDGGLTFNDTIWTADSTDTTQWESLQWAYTEIKLDSFLGEPAVQLCFRYVGFDGADAAIDNVAITFVSGMNEHAYSRIRLFPNPTTEYLFIEGKGDRNIKIFNTTGKLINTTMLTGSNYFLDISYLVPGFYIIVVFQTENSISAIFPLIVQ